MKLVTILFLMFLSSCGAGGSSPTWSLPSEPKFLVAGQSNTVSRADTHAPAYSTTGLVTINDYYNAPDHFYVPTIANPSMSGVAWLYLGDLLNRKCLFNTVGEGGTNSDMWSGKSAPYLGPDALYFRIQRALAANKYDAILWVQGENDIINKLTEDETYSNLSFIINESRKVQPGIVWFVALDSMTGEAPDNHVRLAERRIINEGLALEGPDLDDLHNSVEYSGGVVGGGDFIGKGLEEHGRRWFQVLSKY